MDPLENDKRFDSVLQQWGRAQPALPSSEAQQLVARIIQAAAEPVVPAAAAKRGWKRAIAWSLATGSVAIAALFAMWRQFPPQEDSRAALVQAATLPVGHVTTLTSQSEALFENRLRWIADANRELLLGIDDTGTSSELDRPKVAVHVVVFRRAVGSTHWNTTWKTSIVLRNDEPVQIDMPQDHSHLRLWAHILPDQMVAVDSDYRRDHHATSDWHTSTVPLAPIPEMVLSSVDGEGEVQVWQSAIVFGKEAL